MRQITTLLGLLIAFTATNVWAQGKAACSLLTASEVGAVGATGQGSGSEMPVGSGPTKGDTVKLCSWRMAAGELALSVSKTAPGASRESYKAMPSWAALKAQGWTEEKNFGSTSCYLLKPPAGPGSTMTTGCVTEAKGMTLSLTIVTAGRTPVPMEQAKALVESAAGHL